MNASFLLARVSALVLIGGSAAAQQPSGSGNAMQMAPAPHATPSPARWDVTRARGKTRKIGFATSEGTWMSADPSPDGSWIVFDLLGHIYRMPSGGGNATVLTQDSGVALNFQPRISPDGRAIAFITDRGGQYNLWVMDADGSDPRPIVSDLKTTTLEPAWSPDGKYLVVRQSSEQAGREASDGIWIYPLDGGRGRQLVRNRNGSSGADPAWPSVSGDGKHLYYQVSMNAPERQALAGAYQLRRLEIATGEVQDITAGEGGGLSSGGAVAPEISPDGRWLAFARQIPDGLLIFKGHKYGPRTALWLRDMTTGAERMLMDPIEPAVWSGSKTVGILPRYRWTADSRAIVITQGGKFRRVDALTGKVSTVPFSAKVDRTISEMARKAFRISDDLVHAKFFAWPTSTADGRLLAFQAIGRIYVQDGAGGRARRVTPASFAPLEFAPAWSPDGRWLAFVTWDDGARGHLWKVAASGGAPQRLSKQAGEYANPVWSPDGKLVIVARGEGATARQRTLTHSAWFDIMSFPAEGGREGSEGRKIATVNRPSGSGLFDQARRQLPRPSFGPEGRIYWPDVGPPGPQDAPIISGGGPSALVSVKADGSDRREHLVFPYADEIVPSPDGKWVAFQEGDNVYVTTMAAGDGGNEIRKVDKRKEKLTPLSHAGGVFPRWRDRNTLEYGSGSQYRVHNMDTGRTDSVTMAVAVPKDVPKGSFAFTDARILTLDRRRIIDSGTIAVNGSRIACVGSCSTRGVDRVINARGKTIIPGFVDVHAHHYRDWRGMRPRHDPEQAVYLAYGVTTTLDPSAYSFNAFPTIELVEAGEIIGPRGFSTGDNLLPVDSARNNEITSLGSALDEARKMASWGATAIKQYQQPRRDQRQWMAEAARQVGVNLTSEGRFFFDNLGIVMDGQTGWEHSFGELPMYADGAKFFGQADATFSPTLMVGGDQHWFSQSEVWRDPKLRRWTPWRPLMSKASRIRRVRPDTDYSYPLEAQAMADIIAAGGWGAMGSHIELDGLGAHWEVWMSAAALGTMGALEVASLHGARFVGIDEDVGSIEVGKVADLMVLNSNPLDDIKNTTDMKYVMKDGKLYDPMSLDQIWPKRVPFGPYYWVNDDMLQSNSKASDVFDRE